MSFLDRVVFIVYSSICLLVERTGKKDSKNG